MSNHLDGSNEYNRTPNPCDLTGLNDCDYQSCNSTMQRDRFELLSAYLDGEVTAAERHQIETWLATDASTQRLYARLLLLRQKLQTMPISKSDQSVEQLVNCVTARIEHRPRHLLWGGLAIAALVVGAVLGSMPRQTYAPSVATNSLNQTDEVPSDSLMIALNRPPIEIPKTSLSSPINSLPKSDIKLP